jgi:hypothetical protein
MARDFAALPYNPILALGGLPRFAQEDTVGRHEPPARKTIEVHVRFEVSHRAEDCLADAYERLGPIHRRVLSPAPTPPAVDPPNPQRSPISRRQS